MDYSYIYKITHKPTGLYYIGSRTPKYLNKPAEEDFLHEYFTNSNKMKRLLFLHSPDDFEWWTKSMPREEAKAEEQRLLNESADDPLCLYTHSKKKWQDSDWREKMLSIHASPKSRAKKSAGQKKRFEDPQQQKEHKERMRKVNSRPDLAPVRSANQKKLWEDPEYRENNRAKQRAKWAEPGYREMMREKQRAAHARKRKEAK